MKTELIYIVDGDDMPASRSHRQEGDPNWVFAENAGMASATPAANYHAGPILAGLATGATLLSLTPALAIAAAVVSPIVASRFLQKTEPKADLGNETKAAIEKFFLNHAVTIDMAKHFGFRFPPGHPQVGISYKLHPLANVRDSGKKDLYIPYEKYDALLMEERESELLKLLIHLGATRISISRTAVCAEAKSNSASIAGSASVGEAGIGARQTSTLANNLVDTREFILQGKPWREGDQLEKSCFAWVHFEPSWEALVIAREVGGCLKAGLEIRENTAFSTDKALNANVQGVLCGGKISADAQRSLNEEKVYFVEAEFGRFHAAELRTTQLA